MLRAKSVASLSAAAVSVGPTSTPLIGTDLNRRWVDISNDSFANTVWLRVGFSAGVGAGIELRPNKTWRIETTDAVNAAAGSTTNVSVAAL